VGPRFRVHSVLDLAFKSLEPLLPITQPLITLLLRKKTLLFALALLPLAQQNLL